MFSRAAFCLFLKILLYCGPFWIHIRSAKACGGGGTLRTVFAAVIGDVEVIIEVFVEQQSYFGLIDF